MKKNLILCILICLVFCIAGCNSNTAEEAAPMKYETETSFPAGNADTHTQESKDTLVETELTEVQEQETTTVEETKVIEKTESTPQTTAPIQTPSRVTEEKPTEKAEKSKAEQSSTQPQTTQEAKPTQSVEQPKEENTTAEEKPAEPEPAEKPQTQFDVSPYLSYAQEYAVSIELELDSTATECWDNPISANPNRNGIKSDIQSRLNRYKNSEGFTAVWIWAEKVSDTEYEIYIGYC